MNLKIKSALVSVFDKENIHSLLKCFKKHNIKIISSGGTYKSIKKLGYDCIELSHYTGFNEMLDGRVKTLHPKIHAGILHDRKNKVHKSEMTKQNFPSIDLIVVNFYPFQKVVTETKNPNKIIENIDIGGPTMVRAAAKNFKNVAIITNKNDYSYLIKELQDNGGATSLKFREIMSSKAFGLTAYYDAMIANWFNNKLKIQFPERKTIFGRKLKKLRYGENPHQESAIYINDYEDKKLGFSQIHGKELSYNNLNDMFSSLSILESIKGKGVTVIIKHANPCGISKHKNPIDSFKNAYACDPISAFGGVIACNYKIKKNIALEISKNFLEVILAKGFDKESLKILKKKKNLRIIDINNLKKSDTNLNVVSRSNNFLIQESDNLILDKKNFRVVSKIKPRIGDLNNLIFAFNVCRFVKSNAIVISKNFSTIGIGSGQTSRLDSCDIAINKMRKFKLNDLNDNIYAASDAFFPFTDGVEKLAIAGIKAIIQPSGSIRDKEIIKLANKLGLILVLSKTRHFNH